MTTPTFSSGWDIVMGLGKDHLPANLEVAIFSSCRNIKGEPQILGSSPSPVPRTIFPLGCNCMMSLGKPQLHAKFEVASFIRCRNIIGNPKILRSFPSTRPRPLFPLGEILWWALAIPSYLPNLKSLASAVAEILKGNPVFLRAPLAQGHTHFSSGGIWWQTPAACQIWSHWLHLLWKAAVSVGAHLEDHQILTIILTNKSSFVLSEQTQPDKMSSWRWSVLAAEVKKVGNASKETRLIPRPPSFTSRLAWFHCVSKIS